MADDPFAPPQSDLAWAPPLGTGNVWREGKTLKMTHDAQLPLRCVKCNQPTNERLLRKLYWHPGWVYLTLLPSVFIYLIVALIVRKHAQVQVGVCEQHRRKRRTGLLIGWALLIGSSGSCVAGMSNSTGAPENAPLISFGLLFFVVGLVWTMVAGRLLWPVKIDANEVHLRGAGEPFLASLPPR